VRLGASGQTAAGIGEVFATTCLVATGVGFALGTGEAYSPVIGLPALIGAYAYVVAQAKWYASLEVAPKAIEYALVEVATKDELEYAEVTVQ
jgi:hypothetical protein